MHLDISPIYLEGSSSQYLFSLSKFRVAGLYVLEINSHVLNGVYFLVSVFRIAILTIYGGQKQGTDILLL